MNHRTSLGIVLLIGSALTGRADGLFGTDSLARPSKSVDVQHYKLELTFDRTNRKVSGVATVSLLPLRARLDSFWLHATNLDVQSVQTPGKKSLRFTNSGEELTIHLDRPRTFDDTVTVVIHYSAFPKKGLYFLSPDSTNPKRHAQIWTQGEDMDNRHWFPCWDFPNDMATSEVIASVPDSWSLLSNGKLLGVQHDRKNKTKTFHWRQQKPHVAYLIMIAAGEYTVFTEKHRDIPIEYYVYNERAEDGRRSLAATPRVLKFMEEATGCPYPWEKYAQIFIDDFMWGGMENTSAVTLNTSYLIDANGMLDFTADDVIAHEAAHQWFGDLVTCRDWTELWLNEGFANYFEALYKKHAKGDDAFQHELMNQSASILALEHARGRKPVVSDNSFTTNLYSKGGWVLYMLHNILGDEEFFRAVRHYLRRNAFTSVSTYDFQKSVEEATGRNLDWFFDQWVFKAGHPKLRVTSTWDSTAHALHLRIKQTHSLDSLTGVFVLPFDIECTTTEGSTSTTVWLTQTEQTVTLSLPQKPLMVLVDKGMRVLKELSMDVSRDEAIYRLLHAGDAAVRIAAAKLLKEYPADPGAFAALKRAAMTDRYWGVRREAAVYLGTMQDSAVKSVMMEIVNDASSSVRNAAVTALENFKTADVSRFLRNVLRTDSSYLVRASCLRSLAEVDSIHSAALASKYADFESHRDILRRAALQVLRSLKTREALPLAAKYASLGNPGDIRLLALGILRDVGEEDERARAAVIAMTNDASATIRKSAVRTLAIWGGTDSKAALESRKTSETDAEVRKEIESAIEELTGK